MIRQWSVNSGREVREPIQGNGRVRALALSGNRKWVVSGELELASVWNRNTWQKVFDVHEHTLEVLAVDISPDSTKFATGARDKKVFVWDISTGQRLFGPLEHVGNVVTVRFSPDGEYMATATWDHESLRIYSARTGQLIRSVQVKARGLNTIAWSSDSQRIFASSSNTIKHIYVGTGSVITQWSAPALTNNAYGSLAVANNGRILASFAGSCLSLWDLSTCERLGPVFNHPNQRLWAIVFSLDNNYLATSGENGIITLRNLNDIVPMAYLVQRPHSSRGANLTLQIEAFRGTLRTLESRFGVYLENPSCI